MKVYGYRLFALSVLSLVLLLGITACGPDDSTGQPKPTPTPTLISAGVPKADTPSAVPAYPTATSDDLNLISQAITNTTIGNLNSYHYVMTYTAPLFPTSVTEGDYVQGVGDYTKITEGDFEKEKLEEGNTSYCRDASGKWIVEVPDLRAQFLQGEATSVARMNEEVKKEGFAGTPITMPTISYDSVQQAKMKLFPGGQSGGMQTYVFSYAYAGEDMVNDVTTRHYVGTFSWGSAMFSHAPANTDGTPMPPDEATQIAQEDATAEAQFFAKSAPEPIETLSLWIDPNSEYIQKLQSVFELAPAATSSGTSSSTHSAVLVAYEYPCGVDPHSQPTPTLRPMPQSGESVTTVLITRLNDPSITLPKP
jgi:hypothetical protein